MEDHFSLMRQAGRALTVAELEGCAPLLARYGLSLRQEELHALAAGREESLVETGRVEFGSGILKKLVEAFCDSPYLSRETLADTLLELQHSFYYFRGEAMEQFDDDELIALMRRHFDGVCQGSLEYLSGTTLEELARAARRGFCFGEEEPEENEPYTRRT